MRGHPSIGGLLLAPCHAIPALILPDEPCPRWAARQDAKGKASPHLGHEFCLCSDLWGMVPLAETHRYRDPPLPSEPTLTIGDLLGKKVPFPLPKLVKGLSCLRCLVLWSFGLGEQRGPLRAAPLWLFIAAIKFGGAVGDTEALPSRGLPPRLRAPRGRGGPREGVCPVPCHPPAHACPRLVTTPVPGMSSLGLIEPP